MMVKIKKGIAEYLDSLLFTAIIVGMSFIFVLWCKLLVIWIVFSDLDSAITLAFQFIKDKDTAFAFALFLSITILLGSLYMFSNLKMKEAFKRSDNK